MLGRRHWWEIIMPWSNSYSDWRMRRRAKLDAMSQPPIPAWNAEALPPSLKMLSQAGTQDLRALAKRWHNNDRGYKTTWALSSLAFATADKAVTDAREGVRQAEDEFEKEHGHRLTTIPRPGRYATLVAMLCLFEIPLNGIVFRGFGESEIFTWLMALGLGVGLTFCAHLLGRILREKRSTLNIVLGSVLALLPTAAIILLAILRGHYLSQRVGDTSTWTPGTTIPFFVAWNMILFVVAAVASYRHHDPFTVEVAHAHGKMLRAEHAQQTAEANMKEARVVREKKFSEIQEHAEWIKEEVKRLASLYWTVNLQRREDLGEAHDSDFPNAYYKEVDIAMPQELTKLAWDCDSVEHLKQPVPTAARNLKLLLGNATAEERTLEREIALR